MNKHLAILLPFLLLTHWCAAQYQFIQNKGQWHKKVLFKAYIDAGEVYLENDGIRFLFYDGEQVEAFHHGGNTDSILDCHALKLQFEGSQLPESIETSVENPTYYNYFLGNNRARWASGVKAFERIVLKEVYPGIDFEIFSYQYKLKYNFYVHAGANPEQIAIKYLGADDVLMQDGAIQINTSLRNLVEEVPYTYQNQKDGSKKEIKSAYELNGNVLNFAINGNYRKERTLVIDPTLVFATYSGSTADNFGFTATYDLLGDAYSGGTVYSFGFPTTFGAFQRTWKGGKMVDRNIGDIGRDVGILKYSDDGTKLLFATYLGGTHNEDPHSMVVNSHNELIVFGNTGSADFPTTVSAYDTSFNGTYDIYIAQFSTDGRRLLSSTFLGGSSKDGLNGLQYFNGARFDNTSDLGFNYGDLYRGEVLVDREDNIWVSTVTRSDDFPVFGNSFQKNRRGKHDAVVAKLSSDLGKLLASTYLGGSENDASYALEFDHKGHVFICGGTQSDSLPFDTSAFQARFTGGKVDGFIAKFTLALDSLKAGTYFGTERKEQIYFVQIDKNNRVYVTGQTKSDSFFVKDVLYSQANGKQFIACFNNELDSLEFSSVFGSGRKAPDLSPSAFLVDQCGRIYFSGWGGRANFEGHCSDLPIPHPKLAIQETTLDKSDFYLAVFAENMDSIKYGSYFGGGQSEEHVDGGTSRYNRAGVVYQSVCTGCGGGYDDFPVTKGVVSETNGAKTGNLCNNALFKLDFDAPVLYADFEAPSAICFDQPLIPEDRSVNALEYWWYVNDKLASTNDTPSFALSDTGWYRIKLILANANSCPGSDTVQKEIFVYKTSEVDFDYYGNDCGLVYDFKAKSSKAQTYRWNFGDGWFDPFKTPTHKYAIADSYTVVLQTDSGTACANSLSKPLVIDSALADFTYLVDSCEPYVNFFDNSQKALTWQWQFAANKYSSNDDPGHYFPDTGFYQVILRINKGKGCYDSVVKTIHVVNFPRKAGFDLQFDSCEFKAFAKSSSTYSNRIKWIFTDTLYGDNIVLNAQQPGNYKLSLVADPFSSCPDTASRYFNFNEVPIAAFRETVDSCLSKISLNNQSSYGNKFQWTVGDKRSKEKNPVFLMGDTGVYQLRLVVNPFSACADTVLDTVHIRQVKFAHFDVQPIACTTAVRIIENSLNAKTLWWNYGPDSNSIQIKSDTLFYNSAGNKQVVLIIDKLNADCADTFSSQFIISEPPKSGFTMDTLYCNALRTFISSTNTEQHSIEWLLKDKTIGTGDSLTHYFAKTGKYRITQRLTDTAGCSDTSSLFFVVRYEPKALIDAQIDSCSGLVQMKNLSMQAFSNQWYLNGNAISTETSPQLQLPSANNEHHVLLVINETTPCIDSASMALSYSAVSLQDVWMANIITPNGDGKNDILTVNTGDNGCLDMKLIIFNRWGEKVFETEGTELTWDAIYKGAQLNSGVYYYLLYANDQQRNGTITVLSK
ncbi:T9SS type B sorting domain-containing protein [bacterium]|nr:T9SS type B sorting domain-containing protein [bacterium]